MRIQEDPAASRALQLLSELRLSDRPANNLYFLQRNGKTVATSPVSVEYGISTAEYGISAAEYGISALESYIAIYRLQKTRHDKFVATREMLSLLHCYSLALSLQIR